jgi:hypothetical protein
MSGHSSFMQPARPVAAGRSRFAFALTAALCVSAAAVQAQTWETVDDIDAPAAGAREVVTDSTSNVFVAGYMKDETTRHHAVVMKSSDGGVTWETSADIPAPQDNAGSTYGSAAGFTAIAAAQIAGGENHLVAAGRIKRVYNASGVFSGQWLIKRSKDAGVTWETVDDYTHPTYEQISSNTFPGGVAVDSSGNIYVAGSAVEKVVSGKKTTTVNHWLVRKGVATAGGMTWTTVGDFAYTVTKEWEIYNYPATAITCVGNDVFVGGGGGGSWVVRKSSDGGATWPVVDSYRFSTSDNSQAFGIAADSAGNIYLAGLGRRTVTSGRGNNATTVTDQYWIVRRGAAGGTVWTLEDQFPSPAVDGRAGASAVTVTSDGDVHVAGYGPSLTSPSRWITRRRSAATGLWSTTDDFSLSSTGSASANSITFDPFGNLFATGTAVDAAGVSHGWIVRREPAP